MAPRALSPVGKHLVAQASTSAVDDAAAALRPYIASGRWLGGNNRYQSDSAGRFTQDVKDQRAFTPRDHKHLRELLAASAPVHCIDAWGYLGRSAAAALRGDADTARHLAYYAELRSAMSLLARCGIGILNARHFVVDDSGITTPLTRTAVTGDGGAGTHVTTWLVLEQWSKSTQAAELLSDVIRPERVHLRDWIDAVPGLGAYAPLAPQWFKLFGADIKRFARDRDARNFASYRPSRITQRTFGTAGQTAEFVANLWQLIDQDTASFARLDRHLLRIATEQAFVVAQHGAAGVGSPAFVQAVDQQIAGLQLTEVQAASMRAFQLRQASPTDSLLVHHGRQPVRRLAADHHLDVMARAAVLARIATGASRALLDVAGIQLPQLHFWWGAVLTDRGFSNTASIEDLEDAAEDVRAAAADLDDWSKDPGVDTYESLRVVCRDAIGLVDAPELAGVFGLAS